MTPTKLPKSICPGCGYVMDAASSILKEKDRPDPGSFSICFNCAAIGIYDQTLHVRAATDEEVTDLLNSPVGLKCLLARRDIRNRGPLPIKRKA